jgi:hypothetical protein
VRAILIDARLDGASLRHAQLQSANLSQAHLEGASLHHAMLQAANFSRAYLNDADFLYAEISVGDFQGAVGVSAARNLETASTRSGEVRNLESAIIPFRERWLGWHRIRGIGRLPLFAISYAALALIPFWLYLLDIFNHRVDSLHEWAVRHSNQPGTANTIAGSILEYIHKEPPPLDWQLSFVAAVLLAIASTIFAMFCPERVKEFSSEQWQYELNSPIHYMAL